MALLGIVTVILEYINRLIFLIFFPIILALCLMLLVICFALNYAGIIGLVLQNTDTHTDTHNIHTHTHKHMHTHVYTTYRHMGLIFSPEMICSK